MEYKPGVTLIIATYNPRDDWFDQCLRSIPYNHFYDVIICDDGSKDVVSDATMWNTTNMGIAYTLNRMIEQVETKWIAQIGHDDCFDMMGVCHLLDNISVLDVDIISFPVRIFSPYVHGKEWIWPANNYTKEAMLQNNGMAGASWITKDLWTRMGGYQYKDCEDWDFMARAICSGAKVYYHPYTVYNYRVHKHGYCESHVMPNIDRIRREIQERCRCLDADKV